MQNAKVPINKLCGICVISAWGCLSLREQVTLLHNAINLGIPAQDRQSACQPYRWKQTPLSRLSQNRMMRTVPILNQTANQQHTAALMQHEVLPTTSATGTAATSGSNDSYRAMLTHATKIPHPMG